MSASNSSSISSESSNFSSELIVMSTVFRDVPSARCAAFAALLFIYTFTVAANLTLGLVIVLNATLHQPMYVLMALLALTDIVEITNTVPRIMTNLVAENTILMSECVTQMFFYHITVRLQALILTAMAVDRYVAVAHPLRYHALVSTARVLRGFPVLLAIAVVPIIAYVDVLRLNYCHAKVLLAPNCQVSFLSTLSCSDTSSFLALYYVNITSGLIAPLAVILLTYALMLRQLRGFGSPASCTSSAAPVSRAAAHTCVTHFAVISVSFGSIFFTFCSSLQPSWQLLHPGGMAVLQSVQYVVPPALNPLIYGLRTARIRKSLARALARRVGAVARRAG